MNIRWIFIDNASCRCSIKIISGLSGDNICQSFCFTGFFYAQLFDFSFEFLAWFSFSKEFNRSQNSYQQNIHSRIILENSFICTKYSYLFPKSITWIGHLKKMRALLSIHKIGNKEMRMMIFELECKIFQRKKNQGNLLCLALERTIKVWNKATCSSQL